MSATAGALNQNFSLTNLSGTPAVMTIVAGNPQSAAANAPYATALAVKVTDSQNNPLSNVFGNVYAAAQRGQRRVWGSSTVATNASGVATAPLSRPTTRPGLSA